MLNTKLRKFRLFRRKSKYHWTAFSIVFFIVFGLYASTWIGSLIWTFLNSLKSRFEYMQDCVSFPKDWLFSNFPLAFKMLSASGKPVFLMLFNSLWIAISGPTINLLTATMASYVMSKYKFPGKALIWGIMITCMVIPIYGSAASALRMYKFLGIYNTPFFVVATSISGLGGSIMIIAAFDGVSNTYADSAFIDGAGHFRIFWQIMVPQISGLLSALWIMSFIGSWNGYMTSLMWLPDYITLSTGLYIYQEENARTLDTPLLFSGSLLCLIPVLTLFVIFQDKLMNLSFGGGIKG